MTTGVFVKKRDKRPNPHVGLPVIHLIGCRPTPGEIGIEIEVEGNKFPKSDGYQNASGDEKLIPRQWSFTKDGSLRGQDNAEYVLTKPIQFDEVERAVADLWKMFADYGSILDDSNRTSVHVHLNVQNFYLNRLCSFVAMYFAVEELLTAWCGDHRVGNLFCLRGKDAPAIIRRLKEFFQEDGCGVEFSSGMHYAGLNAGAIHKFGSVEIRALRGVNDPKVILDWVSILRRLYTISEEFKDPRDVVTGFSGAGPMAWLQGLLGDKYSTVVNNVPHTTDEIRDMLYEGIRLAQDLCYCRDWSQFREKPFEVNPFGRRPKVSATPAYVDVGLVNPATTFSTVSFGNAATELGITIPSSPPSPSQINNTQTLINLTALFDAGDVSFEDYQYVMSQDIDYIKAWLDSYYASLEENEDQDEE